MQYGLKNLTNAAKSRKRKLSSSFSAGGNTTIGMLDDSGIVMSDNEYREEKSMVSKEVEEDVTLISVESVEVERLSTSSDTAQTHNGTAHRALISKPSPPRTRSSRAPTIASMLRSPSPSPQAEQCRSYRTTTVTVSAYRRA